MIRKRKLRDIILDVADSLEKCTRDYLELSRRVKELEDKVYTEEEWGDAS